MAVSVDRDLEYAGGWFEKAAGIGMLDESEKAQLVIQFRVIGEWYLDILREDPDIYGYPQKAEDMFAWAVKFGDAETAMRIASIYEAAEELPDHKEKAAKWLKKSADLGSALALYNLGVCYQDGNGVSQDEVHARQLWEKAAAQNLADAQFWLGVMYYNGEGGLVRDLTAAKKLVQKAADQGFEQAKEMLAGTWFTNPYYK